MSLQSIEVCSGMGGTILGLDKSGIDTVEAYEYDPHPAQTLRNNFKTMKVREIDIHQISFVKKDSDILVFPFNKAMKQVLSIRRKENNWTEADRILYKFSLNPKMPLVFSGGVPCPPYSELNMRKRDDDPRIETVDHFIRIVGELHPNYVIFENVTRFYPELKQKVIKFGEDLGYQVNAGYENSVNYGDRTARKRWYCIFSRDRKVNLMPTHGPALKPVKTVGDILGTTEEGSEIGITANKLERINQLVKSDNFRSTEKKQWNNLPGKQWDGIYIANPDLPARAIVDATKMNYAFYDQKLEKVTRMLNFRELKMIQGFPRNFDIAGKSINSRAKQIGNANPVNISRAIGKAVIKHYEKTN